MPNQTLQDYNKLQPDCNFVTNCNHVKSDGVVGKDITNFRMLHSSKKLQPVLCGCNFTTFESAVGISSSKSYKLQEKNLSPMGEKNIFSAV